MNSYTHEFIWSCHIWIHMLWIHIWIHILWIHIHCDMNSYINSWNLCIHMIFSFMNSYVSWIHIWFRVYQGSRWTIALSVLMMPTSAAFQWQQSHSYVMASTLSRPSHVSDYANPSHFRRNYWAPIEWN